MLFYFINYLTIQGITIRFTLASVIIRFTLASVMGVIYEVSVPLIFSLYSYGYVGTLKFYFGDIYA